MDYGKRIKELREAAGMTQIELASLAKITQPHLCNIENGEIGVTAKTGTKIAAALGIKLADLFREE